MTHYLDVVKITFPCGSRYSCDVQLDYDSSYATFTATVELAEITYVHTSVSFENVINKMKATLGNRLAQQKEPPPAIPYCLSNSDLTELLSKLEIRLSRLENQVSMLPKRYKLGAYA